MRVFHHSPEDGNIISFRNVVFFRFLEHRMMDKVQKPSNPECYTPSSEPFKIYISLRLLLTAP
jgi:hypothetical protein